MFFFQLLERTRQLLVTKESQENTNMNKQNMYILFIIIK